MKSTADIGCACKGVRTCKICDENTCRDMRIAPADDRYDFVYNVATSRAELRIAETSETIHFSYPGVYVFNNFISEMEEDKLISQIDNNPWKDSQSGRRKQDYGPKVNFKRKKVKLGSFNGLPAFMKIIVERLNNLPELCGFKPVELCNLEYASVRGSSIDPHFDDDWLWGERLVTLNLLSDTKLTMTHPKKSQSFAELDGCLVDLDLSRCDIRVKIPLSRCSLVVISGPARYNWMHGIERADVSDRRICCTFRELSSEFLIGSMKSEGQNMLEVASSFNGDVVL